MKRGDVWLAEVGGKARPVLVLTRTEVIDVRELVTVAEVTTSVRGLAVEVALDGESVGVDRPSVVNGDGVHTVRRRSLTRRLGELDADAMARVCRAVALAIGCESG